MSRICSSGSVPSAAEGSCVNTTTSHTPRAGAVATDKSGGSWALPIVAVKKGADYRKALASHLASMGVQAEVKKIAGMQRVTVKSGKQSLRANFIVFSCTAKAEGDGWLLRPPRGLLLKDLLTP